MQVAVAWSGGKDAARMLQYLRAREDREVVELFTTAIEDGPTTMHRIPRNLIERQAAALGHPVRFVDLPPGRSGDDYEAALDALYDDYERRGVDAVAYADLLLEDVRAYREDHLVDRGLDGLWPLWGRDTADVGREFVDAGFRATVVCVDADALDESFAGRSYDESFLADLPADVDPAGENGEFHTFVHDGPPFAEPVAVEVGERYTREADHGSMTLHYCELSAGG